MYSAQGFCSILKWRIFIFSVIKFTYRTDDSLHQLNVACKKKQTKNKTNKKTFSQHFSYLSNGTIGESMKEGIALMCYCAMKEQ